MNVDLDHTVVTVTDWERSNAFYRDVLGAEIVELDRGRYAYRLPDGRQLNVHGPGATPEPRAADPVRPGNSDLCFLFSGSANEAFEYLRARGIGTSVYFRDPDGSLLELISYRA